MANKDQGLKVDLVGGLLTVTIGVSQVCATIATGTVFENFEGGEGAEITDEDAFARAIVAKLWAAKGDSTPFHDALEVAACRAIEDGAEGLRFPGGA